MATAALAEALTIGPDDNGLLMTPEEFDDAEFAEGWRYELINGVLIVSPIPFLNEADPNQYLGFLLLYYQEYHPQGAHLDATFPERLVRTGKNRRRADRVLFVGLGRRPRRRDKPGIIAEFVSKRKRDRVRDLETKRDEYMATPVKEYWVFDRFIRTLTVFSRSGRKIVSRVYQENDIFRTPLLPGFEIPLQRLFLKANQWDEDQPD